MEYAAGGELYDYLASKRGIAEEDSKSFFRQIVSAVRYCHKVQSLYFCIAFFSVFFPRISLCKSHLSFVVLQCNFLVYRSCNIASKSHIYRIHFYKYNKLNKLEQIKQNLPKLLSYSRSLSAQPYNEINFIISSLSTFRYTVCKITALNCLSTDFCYPLHGLIKTFKVLRAANKCSSDDKKVNNWCKRTNRHHDKNSC